MKKIVVIEDNAEMCENIKELLELSNYSVRTAKDGVEGVQLIEHVKPDLVLCDIMMPELDGYGVLSYLSKYPDTRGIPFIFLTAKSEKNDFRKGMSLGADDYISKPFQQKELLDGCKVHVNIDDTTLTNLFDSCMNNKEINNGEAKRALYDLRGIYVQYDGIKTKVENMR